MADENPDTVRVQTDEQLRAMASHTRHRILRILRDGPATITQVADRMGIAKGSSNHHLKTLARAGLVHVVETRKVGSATEHYYAMVSNRVELPDSGGGQDETLMRHALIDIETAPPNAQKTVFLKHARLSAEVFDEFDQRLQDLVDEMGRRSDPAAPAADFFVAFYRPTEV